jgi:ABC-type sulfate/molybdate transport systems ATPase subunit
LFEKCIKTALSGKTVVLVTHQLQYLPQCDSVVVMLNGTISAHGIKQYACSSFIWSNLFLSGAFDELMNKMDFSELIGQHVDLSAENPEEGQEKNEAEVEVQQEASPQPKETEAELKKADDAAKTAGKLTKAEAQKVGKVSTETYKQYAASGGAAVAVIVFLLHIISQGANVFSFWWLTYWTSHPDNGGFNIGIYALLLGYAIFNLFIVAKI